MPVTCSFTGHRPEKLPWGFNKDNPDCQRLKLLLRRQIENLITARNVTHFLTGMARGADTYDAEIVLQLKSKYPVTLECVIAHEGQAANWPESDRDLYFFIVAQSDKETLLQHRFTLDCYKKQNRYMVDQSGFVLAVWNGSRSGAGSAVRYARQKGRYILRIGPVHLTVTELAPPLASAF